MSVYNEIVAKLLGILDLSFTKNSSLTLTFYDFHLPPKLLCCTLSSNQATLSFQTHQMQPETKV